MRTSKAPGAALAPSLRPALFVAGLALMIFVAGTVATGLLTGSTGGRRSGGSISGARGGQAGAGGNRSATVLWTMVKNGQPPPDVLDAVPVPQGASVERVFPGASGGLSYDTIAELATRDASGRLESFFGRALSGGGWSLTFKGKVASFHETERLAGAAPGQDRGASGRSATSGPFPFGGGGYELLARRAASDSRYWDVAVMIGSSSSGAAGSAGKGRVPGDKAQGVGSLTPLAIQLAPESDGS